MAPRWRRAPLIAALAVVLAPAVAGGTAAIVIAVGSFPFQGLPSLPGVIGRGGEEAEPAPAEQPRRKQQLRPAAADASPVRRTPRPASAVVLREDARAVRGGEDRREREKVREQRKKEQERAREARKKAQERAREALKKRQEQAREALKKQQEQAREAQKKQEEQAREAQKKAEEKQREQDGGREHKNEGGKDKND